ncbi:phospholipase A2 [Sphaerisporangium fuscum]|uniref:phospholipase A2 n=1 Tax=Sphaerisporangium fuscum TaxID=2835868 RepID=UPI001BDDB74C|nr:phospholipase A2 [Sphaerisporangium fuscum]
MVVLTLAATALVPAQASAPPGRAAAAPPVTRAAKTGCPDEMQGEASVRLAVRLCGKRIKVSDLTTETDEFYVNPDGTTTREHRYRPVRVRRDGGWTPVDTTLVAGPDGSIAPKAAAMDVRFSGGGDGPLVTAMDDGTRLRLGSPFGRLPAPALNGSSATYPDVLPGVDLVVTADVDGFAQKLVVKDRAAADDPALKRVRFPAAIGSGTLSAGRQGGISVLTPKGKAVFVASAAEMWDHAEEQAAARPGAGAPQAGLTAARPGRRTLMGAAVKGGALEVTPDLAMLKDPATTYPVTIDPGFTSTRSSWTYVESAYPTTTYWNSTDNARVGTSDGGSHKVRSFFNMNLSGMGTRKHIVSATFNAKEIWAWSCTAKPVELHRTAAVTSGTNWNNQPASNLSIGSKNVAYGWSSSGLGGASSCPSAWVGWDVTSALQGVMDSGGTTLTLMLKATSETDNYSWKRFENNPNISITYNTVPATPTAQSVTPCAVCTSPAVVGSARPTFKSAVSDPDGQALRADFEVWAPDHVTKLSSGSVSNVSSGATASWTPSANLANGTQHFRVRTYDGVDYSAWSGWFVFTVDTAPPKPPAVDSTDYPADDWAGGAGRQGRFTITPPGTDVSTLLWSFDNGTQQSAANSGTPLTVAFTPAANGPHTMTAWLTDKAGNTSPVTTYTFYAGHSAVTSPSDGQVAWRRVVLAAQADDGMNAVTFAYRRGSADSWHQIPAADVRVKASGAAVTWPVAMTSGRSPELTWDATHTLTTDGTVDIRAEFAASTGTAYSKAVQLTVDRDAEGAATQPLGPGVVNLQTGDFQFSAIEATAFGVSVIRSFSSRQPKAGAAQEGMAPIFGSAWTASGLAQTSSSAYSGLKVTSATSVELTTAEDLAATGFTKNADGSFTPQPDAPQLELTYASGGDRYTLTDKNTGDQTVFEKVAPSATGYVVRGVYPPVSKASTVFVYDRVSGTDGTTVARPTRIIAPTSALSSQTACDVDSVAALPKGCRVLNLTYATATTAAGSQLGDVAGQLKRISLWEGGSAEKVKAEYRYDAAGQLREAAEGPAVTTYDYDTAGRVVKTTPPGELPWTFTYGKAGNADTTSDGMLLAASRPALQPGSATQVSGTATSSVVYDVPVSGTGAPYAMGEGDVAAWDQGDAPADATAVFPADQVPASATGRGALASGDYRRATVHYLDAAGREVNKAEPGGYVSATQYDANGDIVRQLSAANRALALGQGARAGQDLSDLGLLNSTTAQRARVLSTESVHSADGQRLEAEFGPLHLVTLEHAAAAQGSLPEIAAGTAVPARRHTASVFDEGRPTDGSAKVENLVTTETVGASLPGRTADADTRTTKYSYDWVKGLATRTVTDPGGLDITKITAYDGEGRTIETRMPKSNGTDAGTTYREYYTADGSGTCGAKPEWAGLLCRTGPKSATSGGGANPGELVTKVYTYTTGGEIASVAETANGVTRTTTTTYDDNGRVSRTTVTGGAGEAVPEVSAEYDTNGNPVRTTASNGTAIVREYDALGRQISYTDADGGVTRVQYDALDRVVKRSDSVPSSTTYVYDTAKEPRGLVTGMTDSVAGSFAAQYDADGAVAREDLPGGVSYSVIRDQTGSPRWRGYQTSAGTRLLDDGVTWSVHGQQLSHNGVSAQTIGYDAAGRISELSDTFGSACVRRTYGYDANSNRTGYGSVPCSGPGGSVGAHAYDTGDRLVDAGYSYDEFGRTKRTPAGEKYEYYSTDLARSIVSAAGDMRQTWELDPQLRRRQTTVEQLGGGTWTTALKRIDHFDADDDTPSWTVENTATGAVTRDVSAISGGFTATTSASGDVRLQLTNLHDDVNVVYDLATGTPTVLDFDEFGNPRAGQPAARYGWHGAAQREAGTPDGSLLMGVRLYQPKLGRFLQTDPVPGGGDNAYDYAGQSPTSNADLDGRKWWWCTNFWHFAFNHCGMYSIKYHGSWRPVYWVRTPGGWWVRGVYYDYCTSSPDRPLGFDFRSACMMHDYGYALLGSHYLRNKHEVDYVFYYVLYWGVCSKYFFKGVCRGIAYKYFLAVWYFGKV